MTTEQRNAALEVAELTNSIAATLKISPQNIYSKRRTPEPLSIAFGLPHQE